MGNTRGLTDKPITPEVIEENGRVVAAHLSTVITDPTASNAVQIPDSDQYPSANATGLDPLNVHQKGSPADALDLDEGAGTNEVQTLSKTGTVTSGTFTLTWEGDTTAAIAFDATAAQVKTALVAASPELATADVTATGGPLGGTPVVLTFTGSYAAQDVSLITADSTNLVGGGTYGVVETTKGVHADAP
jgi:hypothetical protein